MLSYVYTLIVCLISTLIPHASSHTPCGLYGAPPCQYVPAPPGHTPSCARPGRTYCEHIDHYPTHLIKHLVHKWGYDSKNLIVDESGEEFESLRYRHHESPSPFYFPASVFGPPSANHLGQFEGYNYGPPKSQPHINYNIADQYSEPVFLPKPRESNYVYYNPSFFPQKPNSATGYRPDQKTSTYNPAEWFKRYTRDISRQQEKPLPELVSTETADDAKETIRNGGNSTSSLGGKSRTKRQSPGRTTLCEVSIQYITPQAALNSKGNWMYVVNNGETARQLVRTEVCASSVCSNLCQLPNTYTSKCEQKYVQKRLVALNSNGQNLYTDTFWFPSCCVCTLSN